MTSHNRWAWVEIDLDAVAHNVRTLRSIIAPAALSAVVKANGYGHGARAIAQCALDSGATGLCVALVAEGVALRDAGIEAPILVLSEQPPELVDTLVRYQLTATVYTEQYASMLATSVGFGSSGYPVHIKVDTGMQRVGVPAGQAIDLIRSVMSLAPRLSVEGLYTHLACADEPSFHPNREQLDTFSELIGDLQQLGISIPCLHAANSAGAVAIAEARFSLVRVGIALYGISPGRGVDHLVGDLRPVMSLHARVSYVKRVSAGSHVSYGWRHRFDRDTTLATLPIGYADGVPRRLGTLPDRPGADVLIGGRRCPIVGVVTMDQLMVDVGDHDVSIGDQAVLIGGQGDQLVRVEEWADRLGTIGYEIVCAISNRVPRVVRGGTVGLSIEG